MQNSTSHYNAGTWGIVQGQLRPLLAPRVYTLPMVRSIGKTMVQGKNYGPQITVKRISTRSVLFHGCCIRPQLNIYTDTFSITFLFCVLFVCRLVWFWFCWKRSEMQAHFCTDSKASGKAECIRPSPTFPCLESETGWRRSWWCRWSVWWHYYRNVSGMKSPLVQNVWLEVCSLWCLLVFL